MELRPLGFGEIFDRAITLYVRNFVPFAGIVCVVILPLAVLQYFLDRSSVPQFDQMIRILEHPGNAPPALLAPAFLTSPGVALLFGVLAIVVWVVWPFALNACAIGVARLYRGRRVEFAPCYRASLQRWPSVLGVLLIEAGIFVAWYVAFVVAVVVLFLLTVVLARASIAAGVVGGVVTAFVLLAGLLALAPLFVALTFGMNAVVIEERSAFQAIALGFARVFNRFEIWRALLFSLAAFAIMAAASSLVGIFAMVAMVYHWIALEVILTSVFRAAITPFSIVLLAVYYFDVRIRHEGFDLEAALDRLTGVAQIA